MNATRITAPDTDALAAFYKSAFGMFEVQRIAMGGGAEIMLNFGKTEAAARANPGSQLVLYPREANLPEDTTAHLIVNVTDMATTVAAIKAAGGNMEREPFGYGDTGMLIGMGIDPAGNHFEMLYFPPAP
jgi:predicted enzyme related to lactoylglutathione lyase